jgi:predicted amidohydrolase
MPDHTLRIAVAQSTVREDPTDAAALGDSGAEIRRLMRQAAEAGARLVHFTEGALCFPSKHVMSDLVRLEQGRLGRAAGRAGPDHQAQP